MVFLVDYSINPTFLVLWYITRGSHPAESPLATNFIFADLGSEIASGLDTPSQLVPWVSPPVTSGLNVAKYMEKGHALRSHLHTS